jgi:hypothetical protein
MELCRSGEVLQCIEYLQVIKLHGKWYFLPYLVTFGAYTSKVAVTLISELFRHNTIQQRVKKFTVLTLVLLSNSTRKWWNI